MEPTETHDLPLFELGPDAEPAATPLAAPAAAVEPVEPPVLLPIYERYGLASVQAALVVMIGNVDTSGPAPWHRPELGPCWLWKGATREKGREYGCMWFPGDRAAGRKGFTVYTHRFAWEALRGPIPEGMTVDHVCRRPRCSNPAHLVLATRSENSRNDHGAGTMPAGRTACPAGHPYDAENTYIRPASEFRNESRGCRTCMRDAARRARRAAADVDQLALFAEPADA